MDGQLEGVIVGKEMNKWKGMKQNQREVTGEMKSGEKNQCAIERERESRQRICVREIDNVWLPLAIFLFLHSRR